MTRLEEVFEGLRQGFASGRLGHAYLICGDPRGEGRELAERLGRLVLFPGDEAAADLARHPDYIEIHPVGKGRVINVDNMRAMTRRMATTSYAGGWKVAVLYAADCMNPAASNAFLKTLEEPPPDCLFLLVTDAPHRLLPTIQSRCQRILLGMGSRVPEAEWVEPLLELLAEGPPLNPLEALGRATTLASILAEVKKQLIEEEKERDPDEDEEAVEDDVIEARVAAKVREQQTDLLQVLQFWYRDILMALAAGEGAPLYFEDRTAALRAEADRHTVTSAQQQLEAVEAAIRRIGRNVPAQAAFEMMCVDQGRAFQVHGRAALAAAQG